MQYLLTEDEMEVIRRERSVVAKLPGMETLINVVRHIACNMVDTKPIKGGTPQTRPHGCIHVEDPRGPQWQVQYCDYCSVAGICPQSKNWSK
jgi:hypothetical protein